MLRASIGAFAMLGGCSGGGSAGGGTSGGGGGVLGPGPAPSPTPTPTPLPTPTPSPTPTPVGPKPITTAATDKTVALYRFLCGLTNSGSFMVGTHERFDIPGIAPLSLAAANTFETMTGKRPAWLTYEWVDPLQTSADPALDAGVAGPALLASIRAWAAEGGIVSVHDHPGNPRKLGLSAPMGTLDYQTDWTEKPLASIREGGSRHGEYRAYLDRLAAFFDSLVDGAGVKIPVLWRPFHEIDGDWFWWNDQKLAGDDMIAVWRDTVTYLRDRKGVTNVLYVHNISTDPNLRGGSTVPVWPGDTYVDLLSVDHYDNKGWATGYDYRLSSNARAMKVIGAVAAKCAATAKPALIAEMGFNIASSTSPTIWESVFDDILATPALRVFSGVALWRPPKGPEPGTPGAASLRAAVSRPGVRTLGATL